MSSTLFAEASEQIMGVNTTKRPRGRPPGKKEKLIAVMVKFPASMLELLDLRAKNRGLNRSAHLRTLASDDLEQHEVSIR